MSDLVQRLAGVRLEGIEELCWEAADRIEQLEAALAAADVMAEQVTMAHGFTYEYGHRSLAEALTAYREARNQTGRPE